MTSPHLIWENVFHKLDVVSIVANHRNPEWFHILSTLSPPWSQSPLPTPVVWNGNPKDEYTEHAQKVLTYPPTPGFHWWVGNTDLKWKQIQAIYLLNHLGGSEVVFQKRANYKAGRFTLLGPVAQLVFWPVAHAHWHASYLEAKPGRERADLSWANSCGWTANVCCLSRHFMVPW